MGEDKKSNSKKAVVMIVGFINTLWLAYRLSFSTVYFSEHYAKYVWSSFENASSAFQKWVVFILLIVLIGGIYVAFAFGESTEKAWIFTIITVVPTILIGDGFWKIVLFILFFPEFGILALADMFCWILRFLGLNGLSSFILGALQLVIFPLNLYLVIRFFYAPLEVLSEMEDSSSSSGTRTEYINPPIRDRDFMDEVRKDRILETLKDIDFELKNRR